mgnify:FL=1|tara:strand:+ start:1069 stop:2004 length:936 start_codon:yes stop_codon:yes gene_type:complete
MKLISFVFSFRNEEKNLKNLIQRIDKAVKKTELWDYELIFVNDDSTDNSENLLLDLQKEYKIKIVNMSRRFGTNPCVLAGFENCSGDCIIYMDSDLQDPPELITELIKQHEKGFDIVHTRRTKRLGEPKTKLFFTSIAYSIINKLSDIDLQKDVGDFKLISRRALDKILEQKEYNPYIRGLSVWVGFKQTYVDYVRDAREAGESKFSLFAEGPVTQFIRGVTSYSLKPLYSGVLLGFFAFLFSIFLIVYALYAKLAGLAVPGTTGILIVVSFFSGALLSTIGIMGIYLARIFEQTKGRTRYIIKNIKDYKK